MVSFRKTGNVDTDRMPEKILALSQYDTAILSKLHRNKQNKMLIEKGAANLIAEYFMRLVDAKARADRKSLHHVYEWDQAGKSDARLFKKKITPGSAGTLISFNFTKSKEPNSNGHVFYNKAFVMESGQTVTIKPKNGKVLMYKIETGRRGSVSSSKMIITSKPSVVKNSGGDLVKGSFEREWKSFSYHQANSILKQFRYFESVNEALKQKRKSIVPKINRGMISGMIAEASKDATMIATKAAVTTSG